TRVPGPAAAAAATTRGSAAVSVGHGEVRSTSPKVRPPMVPASMACTATIAAATAISRVVVLACEDNKAAARIAPTEPAALTHARIAGRPGRWAAWSAGPNIDVTRVAALARHSSRSGRSEEHTSGTP